MENMFVFLNYNIELQHMKQKLLPTHTSHGLPTVSDSSWWILCCTSGCRWCSIVLPDAFTWKIKERGRYSGKHSVAYMAAYAVDHKPIQIWLQILNAVRQGGIEIFLLQNCIFCFENAGKKEKEVNFSIYRSTSRVSLSRFYSLTAKLVFSLLIRQPQFWLSAQWEWSGADRGGSAAWDTTY